MECGLSERSRGVCSLALAPVDGSCVLRVRPLGTQHAARGGTAPREGGRRPLSRKPELQVLLGAIQGPSRGNVRSEARDAERQGKENQPE